MGCLCCRPTSLDTDNSNAISFSHCDRRALLKKTFAGASALVATAPLPAALRQGGATPFAKC